MKQRILIVDDEIQIAKAVERFLTHKGFEAFIAGSFEEGKRIAERERLNAAFIDLKIGDRSGIDLVVELKKIRQDLSCILMTGFGTIESAVQAIKKGAYDYLTKPFQLENLEQLLHQALREQSSPFATHSPLSPHSKPLNAEKELLGNSEAMKEVQALIEKVAKSNSTILILGESGTGKELVARAIHTKSHRAHFPLVAVNCGAIPEELLESELFGHVRGAFTGAVSNKIGRFEAAKGGTIFLDEIGEMSMKLQVKLLRILQEKKFEPVGSSKSLETDVRVVTATNKNLEQAIQDHQFREDLYYRLNVIPIQIPPLRERRADIPILIDHFLAGFAQKHQRDRLTLSNEALEMLLHYSWPGNVRELENMMERLVILKKEGEIVRKDLIHQLSKDMKTSIQHQLEFTEEGLNLKEAVEKFEDDLILRALDRTGWNKNRAAKLLHVNRTTLVEKMKKRHLEPKEA